MLLDFDPNRQCCLGDTVKRTIKVQNARQRSSNRRGLSQQTADTEKAVLFYGLGGGRWVAMCITNVHFTKCNDG